MRALTWGKTSVARWLCWLKISACSLACRGRGWRSWDKGVFPLQSWCKSTRPLRLPSPPPLLNATPPEKLFCLWWTWNATGGSRWWDGSVRCCGTGSRWGSSRERARRSLLGTKWPGSILQGGWRECEAGGDRRDSSSSVWTGWRWRRGDEARGPRIRRLPPTTPPRSARPYS